MKHLKLWSAATLLIILALSSDLLLEPEAGTELQNREITFKKIGLSNTIIMDDNPTFTTPEIINKPWTITLEPGTYYWKSSGISETRNFTIISIIGITVNTDNNHTIIENTGNVAENINTITGAFILNWGEKTRIKKTTGEILAQQHE